MRRWILKANATSLDGLVLEDAPLPEPGPGEVRVRVHAASLNYRDQIILTGQYGVKVRHGSFCAWKYGDSSRDENRKFTLDSTVETASAVPELSPGF